MITDSHLHIWDLKRVHYAWLEGNTTLLNSTYLIPEIEPQCIDSGITAAVLVQAANNYEDTDLMLENAEKYALISGVVGWLPLTDPEATAKGLEKYLKNPYFKGVRHLIHDEADDKWLLRPAVIESLKLVARAGISYDVVGILPEHIRCVQQLSEKIPELSMVFDHLNNPPIKAGNYTEWETEMQRAAENPKVFAKISGMGIMTEQRVADAPEQLQPAIEKALKIFGTSRLMVGGDWPVALLGSTYAQIWTAYKNILTGLLPEQDYQKIFSENAGSFYRLQPSIQ